MWDKLSQTCVPGLKVRPLWLVGKPGIAHVRLLISSQHGALFRLGDVGAIQDMMTKSTTSAVHRQHLTRRRHLPPSSLLCTDPNTVGQDTLRKPFLEYLTRVSFDFPCPRFVATSSPYERTQNLQQVFERLQQDLILVNSEKCKSRQAEIAFLGHHINGDRESAVCYGLSFFVLGFYVNTIVKRWWEQFSEIPWPDTLTLLINAYAQSTTERARIQRRTFVRYINLSFCLTTRDVSSRARMRFPTLEHLISAGLITPDELRIYEESATDNMSPINFLPLCWAQELVTEMYKEKNIVFDRAVELLTAELGAYRDKLYKLVIYDWINVPLVYTQVATLIVYAYFAFALFAWQYLDPTKPYKDHHVDLYVPIFGLLRFFFYMGWLKVAETLISPFGEDEDDFEIEEYIERNVQFTNFWDRSYNAEIPPIVKDAYWDAEDINLPAKISMLEENGDAGVWTHGVSFSAAEDPFRGSLANIDFTSSRKMSVFIIPFSCIYAVDVTMGLAGTGAISLPLFSALRRISNFFILIGERYFFGKKHTCLTHLSLCTMVAGAFVAVSGDINFDLVGYGFVFINNFSTAAKGLLTKSRLSKHNFSSTTLLFYNSIFMFPFMLVLALITGNVQNVINYPLWSNGWFVAGFLFSCLAAVTLQFLTFECTRLTSALTTSVIGIMKNTIVSYGGMFVGGDYIFTIVNFCGVTLSTIGAITYGISMYLAKQTTPTVTTPFQPKV
nr:UDP glucuronic acid:UDP N acetylgalactosamine [Hymenolepis microstoma]